MAELSGDDIARIGYFALLAVAIGGSLIAQSRRNLGKTFQQMIIWGMIFLGAIALGGLWPAVQEAIRPSQSISDSGQIVLPREGDGHYYADILVNGVEVRFVVDTGATIVVISQDDARKIGLDPATLAYYDRAQTANGEVATAPIWFESMTLGPVTFSDVRAAVNEGDLFGSLLGMSYLSRFSRIEITGNQLILTP